MRPVVDFLLCLVYELQDQVAKARSFAFIDDVREITEQFAEVAPGESDPGRLGRHAAGLLQHRPGLSLKSSAAITPTPSIAALR